MNRPPEETAAAGEMARRVRGFDWSQTPLGAAESWSPNLRLATEIVLASGFPMALRWGPQFIFLYNDAFRSILGARHPFALARPRRKAWPELDAQFGELDAAILAGRHPGRFVEDHVRVIDRGAGPEEIRVAVSHSPVPDPTTPSGVGGILITCLDTTERARAEAALRAVNETLEAAVAQRTRERDRIWRVSEDLLGVSNFEGYFVSVNPAWTTLLGWSEGEIKRLHVDELRHPEDAAHSIAGRARLAAGVPTVRTENRFRHKDGSWRWLAWTMTAEDGLIYEIGRHVTAEKEAAEALRRAGEQLAQSQKMEALGQLTGGIAHDFNNLLMVVGGNAQMLLGRTAGRDERRLVEAIAQAAARGEHLTRQLLAFSRRRALNPAATDLRRALHAFRDLLSSSARDNIELAIAVPGDTWPVSVDVPEFELALVNIVVNARDAIADAGLITISARNVRLAPGDTPDGISGDFVALSVSDTGCGIPPDILPKVVEPFFTTKRGDKGTGLGLSQVYGFCRQSGGAVTIASRQGEETTVTLYLPKSAAPPADEPGAAAVAETTLKGERILLVEDNPEVRNVTSMLLQQLGYRVRAADGAAAALGLLAEGEPVDLVFSDIVMPGDLDGIALARRVREQYPQIRILLATGYAEVAGAAPGDLAILRKPYRLTSLGRALREALASRARA